MVGFSGTALRTEDAGEVDFSAGNCIAHPSIMRDPSISRIAFWGWNEKKMQAANTIVSSRFPQRVVLFVRLLSCTIIKDTNHRQT